MATLEIGQGWRVRRGAGQKGGMHTAERPFLGASEKAGAAGLDPLVR